MTYDQALKLLDLSRENVSDDAVRAAFASKLKSVHPDTADVLNRDVAKIIDDLREARGTLLTESKGLTCKLCGGSGRIPGRLGFVRCTCDN